MDEEQKNKSHKNKTTGNKANKKDVVRKKRAGIDLEPNRGNNVKAFQGPSAGSRKTQKFLRSIEKRETALHVPTMDKTFRDLVSEPPLLVLVAGPPGVGKTTLIRSMVKFYSNRNLQTVQGPITVVAGRSRRITFLECPNTLTAMCDAAKVADLVLLMVDGSYGFEMETFEFLNIAQVHGFPRMFGVVSHLDQLRTGKALKKRKKFLRHRFWHEVAAGAKLLCLSPMVRNMYRPTDVLNLHRLLLAVEPKVASWRQTHSCVLIDRQEDITDPDLVAADPNCNRTMAFYGYSRGKPMKTGQLVHIPGVGDFPLEHLSHVDDPCNAERLNDDKRSGHHMTLNLKQKKLYAPYCDVGGITYDEDAIYVQEDAEKGTIERSGEGLQLLRELQRAEPMDAARAKLEVVRRPVVFKDEDEMELDMDPIERPSDDDDDDEEEEDDALYSDDDNEGDVTAAPKLDQYGLPGEDEEDEEGSEGEGGATLAPRRPTDPDTVRVCTVRHDWSDVKLLRALKDLCVTGNWAGKSHSAEENLATAEGEGDAPQEEEGENSKGYESDDEDFEAQIRGEKPIPKSKKGGDGDFFNNEDDDENEDDEEGEEGQAGKDADAYDAYMKQQMRGSGGRHDALAGVSFGNSELQRAAFKTSLLSTGEGGKHGGGGGSSSGKGRNRVNEEDEDDDEFDILKDDVGEDGGDGKAHTFDDEELNGLVSSFLTAGDGAGSSSSKRQQLQHTDNEEGITFYNEKERYQHSGGSGPNGKPTRAQKEQEEEEAESAAVAHGGALTEEQERIMKKKMEKKKLFDETYDNGGEDNKKNMTFAYYHQMNRKVEEKKEQINAALADVGDDIVKKIQLIGYFSGLYIRLVVKDVPVEFVKHFDPKLPLLAGGLNPGEDEFRIVHTKIKRHRWYPKILKAQDPLLLSMGWRRFQTQPIFATEDPNGRARYLKYSPEHMHCVAAFYAPVVPPNTGFLAIPVKDLRTTNFRISCSGYTVGNDVTTSIVKKLKLTGTPAKIEKTTVFVKNMFSSDIEAAKFVGAKLKAVSGVRGIIKSVMKGKQGLVRATFEDKIFMSDIVFIRAWKSVEPPQYCAMQRNLLDPEWAGMKTMRELRWEHNMKLPQGGDSEYKEIKRRHRVVVGEVGTDPSKETVLLSRNLKLHLPFEMKEAYIPMARSNAVRERISAATTIAPELREQRHQALLDAFSDKADAMLEKKNAAKKRARAKAAKVAEAENEKYVEGLKRAKKETARRAEFRSQHKSRK